MKDTDLLNLLISKTVAIAIEKGMRLAVVLEGLETAPRTVVVQCATLPELVVQQLSNRQRDAVFADSMAVARKLRNGSQLLDGAGEGAGQAPQRTRLEPWG